jgi:putative zinc finger/helix-turn-helix YgiT family protein
MTRKTASAAGKTATRPLTGRRGRVLPADACPSCGSPMREHRGRLFYPVNGEEMAVLDASHLWCAKCGEVVLRRDESRHLRELAIDGYRRRYHLLSADDIRSLRERLGLTQAKLAGLLRLGGNTISRWESGRNVQTAAMDVLLRLIRDLPGSLDYLRTHAA